VYELIATNRNADVRRALTERAVDRVEENEVAGAQVGRVDVSARAELFRNGSRHVDAILIEDIPDEAAAIKP
jgi:hypothetical protein